MDKFARRATNGVVAFSLSFIAMGFAPSEPVPGGVVSVVLASSLTERPRVTFEEKPVLVLKDKAEWIALVGIPLDAKVEPKKIQIEQQGQIREQVIQLKNKNYPSQHLTIKDTTKVELSPENQKRTAQEAEMLSTLFSQFENKEVTQASLTKPVEGRLSSGFGFRRIINKKPSQAHKGIDLAAATGTPILAAKDGTVTLVKDLFYTGNTVVLDHGQGWQTIYCHLNHVNVKKGEQLKEGEILGAVGQTGRATGPHLHFGVSLNQVRVDPELFFRK